MNKYRLILGQYDNNGLVDSVIMSDLGRIKTDNGFINIDDFDTLEQAKNFVKDNYNELCKVAIKGLIENDDCGELDDNLCIDIDCGDGNNSCDFETIDGIGIYENKKGNSYETGVIGGSSNISKEYGKQYIIDLASCGMYDIDISEKSLDDLTDKIMNNDILGNEIDSMIINGIIGVGE